MMMPKFWAFLQPSRVTLNSRGFSGASSAVPGVSAAPPPHPARNIAARLTASLPLTLTAQILLQGCWRSGGDAALLARRHLGGSAVLLAAPEVGADRQLVLASQRPGRVDDRSAADRVCLLGDPD